ncbi:MAG: carbamoyltransferase HypF [Acidiferrobacterales bacterium]
MRSGGTKNNNTTLPLPESVTKAPGQLGQAIRLHIGGRVQAVGFRPFVYRTAREIGIDGWVRNEGGAVTVHAEGTGQALEKFIDTVIHQAPPLARPLLLQQQDVATEAHTGFSIKASSVGPATDVHLPPDYFMCDDCVRELDDPRDRRYRYPFINCTQCGPRYTLITHLPYDRAQTTMAGFKMCDDCRREYEDPLNRRFHAEPIACPVCGPQLQFHAKDTNLINDTESALRKAEETLRQGLIVAVKGIGGYHLLCDATNDKTVERLRSNKRRPHKPFAIMFPMHGDDGLDAVRKETLLSDTHANLLLDPMRPVVLVPRRINSTLSSRIAPGLNEIGVFLPYSPLHYLLLSALNRPLVATSGNISGEPVLTDNDDAEARLEQVVDAFLHHDRPIHRPADDAVFRVLEDHGRPLRHGRGSAPVEMTLPITLKEPLLAVGGHMKNSIALAWDNHIVISPHIGDLDAPRSMAVLEQLVADLQSLYQVNARAVVCDAHPGYASTRWATQQAIPLKRVWHHHAHASAVAGEYAQENQWLVFTWDGVGLGEDGTLWGGDALFGQPGAWQHVARLRPFRLPGGDKAAREPWRSALAVCWESGLAWHPEWSDAPEDTEMLKTAWDKNINSVTTSAAGRLFDAAAALTGLCTHASYEGQGPMQLEAACEGDTDAIALPLQRDDGGAWQTDWAPLLPMLIDSSVDVGKRAAQFHASLAKALCDQAEALRKEHGDFAVGLSGGVFQNRVLTEATLALLRKTGFRVYLPQQLPCNDGGLCYGQIVEAGSQQ